MDKKNEYKMKIFNSSIKGKMRIPIGATLIAYGISTAYQEFCDAKYALASLGVGLVAIGSQSIYQGIQSFKEVKKLKSELEEISVDTDFVI